MANVKVAENHLTSGGVAYFRGHAEEVVIGSIGEKRTPLTKQNYLEVKDQIPVSLARIRFSPKSLAKGFGSYFSHKLCSSLC